MLYPPILDHDIISDDARARVNLLNENLKSPPGAYTGNSKGYEYVRQSVADFISRRDGHDNVNPDHVYLTNGASEGVRTAFATLIRNANDGVLVPIP